MTRGLLGIVVAALVVVFALRPEALSVGEALVTVAIIVVGLLPTLWYFTREDRPFLPLMAGIGLFHVVYFGLSFVLVDINWPSKVLGVYRLYARIGLPDITFDVLTATLTAMICMNTGYWIATRLTPRLPTLSLAMDDRILQIRILTWTLAAVYFVIVFVPALNAVGGLRQGADFLRLVVFGGLFLLWYRKQLSRPEVVVLFAVLLPLEIVTQLGMGFLLSPVVHLFLLIILIIWNFSRVRALALLGAVFVAAFVTYEARYEVRLAVEQVTRQTDPSVTDYLLLPADIGSAIAGYWWTNKIAGTERPAQRSIGSQFGRRISYGMVLAHVMEKTPGEVPFWDGETYRNILTNFVPRIFWPDKPVERFGAVFAHRYDLVLDADHATSINIPWLIEAYINYAWIGLTLVMVLIGAFVAVLEQVFVSAKASAFSAVLGAALTIRLALPESNFTVMTGSIPLMAVLVYGYYAVGLRVLDRIPLLADRPVH